MILCQMSHFEAGLLYLFEKSKMFKPILNHFIAINDGIKVLETCERYGEEDPNLWVDALWYFSKTDDSEKTIQVLSGLLLFFNFKRFYYYLNFSEIERKRLLPPIVIIKDYLIRWLTRENERIVENEKLINQFKDDTEKMRQLIDEMKTNFKVFQATKCSGCNHQLELPSVHFLCGHSYHQQCFESYNAESDSDCPLCLPENRFVFVFEFQMK